MTFPLGDVRFTFVNDTKQGPLLSYRRTKGPLILGENLQIVGDYVHFTVSDANWGVTGSDSSANNNFGTGFLELDFPANTRIYSIQWLTYYTNGGFKEVLMRVDPNPYSQIDSYVPRV